MGGKCDSKLNNPIPNSTLSDLLEISYAQNEGNTKNNTTWKHEENESNFVIIQKLKWRKRTIFIPNTCGGKKLVDAISKSLFLKLFSLHIDCPWRKTRFGSF